MDVLYANHQDKFDPMNGAVIVDAAKLAELLEGRKRKPPFLALLSGDNGCELFARSSTFSF